MWKKDDVTPDPPSTPAPEDRTVRMGSPVPPRPGAERASIGRSITIRGEVSGDEDLLIQGRVDGSVTLPQQSVIVGKEGRVKAGITGRIVTVEGEVEGDLTAQEQVVLRSTARVRGDITAPRLVLEDGANFRGLVDMETPGAGEKKPGGSPGEGTGRGLDKAAASELEKASRAKGATRGSGGGATAPAGDEAEGGQEPSKEPGKALP